MQHSTNINTKLQAALVATAGRLSRIDKSPEEQLGELFNEVQLRGIYSDSKTFVDLIPKKRVRALKKEFQLARKDPHFSLNEFVNRHFYAPESGAIAVLRGENKKRTAREHVTWLWPHLTRRVHVNRGSLFALPHEYVVPGGRFEEQFYWDTYFIMLGLHSDGAFKQNYGMLRNYVYMADKFGYIPTANRTYFVSRSQPPFFADMVALVARERQPLRLYLETLPTLLNEYSFWMKGKAKTAPSWQRVVRMPDGVFLNRYFDNKTSPRPDAHKEDTHTAKLAGAEQPTKTFLDLRAAAESGWDFSSRWFESAEDIHSIRTTDFVPIDLNCMLYRTELQLSRMYAALLQPLQAKKYAKKAERRAEAIRRYCWDKREGWFVDWDMARRRPSSSVTLAGIFALYAGIATKEQAKYMAQRLQNDFLKSGGLITTRIDTGQQWDAPNGWAPLHWVAIVGLRKYGYDELAEKVKRRWLQTVEKVYADHGKMIEKYNVVKPGKLGGGGEYPLQDGFGWTNGVYAALHDDFDLQAE
jgi:alpha,alpha-trehalase